MEWLEASLAFALIMLVLSTMVTTVTELVLRGLNSRENNLRIMIEQLYRQVVRPRLEQQLSALHLDRIEADFLDFMTDNPVTGQSVLQPADQAGPLRRGLRWLDRMLDGLWGRFVPRGATEMSVLEFMERLGSTEIGRHFAAQAGAQLNDMVNDLAQKYDRFCAATTGAFAARAHVVAAILALPLALLLNVDAVRVFQTFLHDGQIRAAVIAQQDAIEAQAKLAQDNLEKTLQEIKDVQAKAAGSANDPGKGPDFKAQLAEVERTTMAMREGVDRLASLGVPIGHAYFPYCAVATVIDPLCHGIAPDACGQNEQGKDSTFARLWAWLYSALPAAMCNKKETPKTTGKETEEQKPSSASSSAPDTQKPDGSQKAAAPPASPPVARSTGSLWSWFFSTLLAGLLIGLGSPFWFKLARGLSQSLQLLRSLGATGKDDKKAQDTPAGPKDPAAPSKLPVEAFQRAVVASTPASHAIPRPLLTRDGRPDRGK